MASSEARSRAEDGTRSPAQIAAADRVLLETLRASARAAECAPRLDHDAALGLGEEAPVARIGAALLRALDSAALRPLPFHPRGTAGLAFGEAWAMGLLLALRRRDPASAAFLLRSGVRRERRREVQRLAERLVARLSVDADGGGNSGRATLESFQSGGRASGAPAAQPACKEHT